MNPVAELEEAPNPCATRTLSAGMLIHYHGFCYELLEDIKVYGRSLEEVAEGDKLAEESRNRPGSLLSRIQRF